MKPFHKAKTREKEAIKTQGRTSQTKGVSSQRLAMCYDRV